MQPKNIKTSTPAQQPAATKEVGFLVVPSSGACALKVCEGVPVGELMGIYEDSLDAVCAFIKRIARDGEHPMDAAIALLTEVVGAMHSACRRGMTTARGDV
ncbi:TPA: hypothetical protein L4856_004907 [Pseudomonas aeruginosa]|nr:hypothetical protein [Pseudomonas aeruginosa]HBO7143927.1 hypothetical protein [Pseudomonas aeruginosa]